MVNSLSREDTNRCGRVIFLCLLIACAWPVNAKGNATSDRNSDILTWNTDSTGPRRFISVHGRRAAIFGYSQGDSGDISAGGLEVWAYPVQILRSYRVAFRKEGAVTGIDGQTILRRIEYRPEAVTRIYAGPDFVVRERLFVPLDESGVTIRYEVDSTHPIDIEIRFIPVLDLMWPASIGGQETAWNVDASGYLLSELTHRFTASITSPDIVAHDDTPNIGKQVGRMPGLAFTIRPGPGRDAARVVIAGSTPGKKATEIAALLLQGDGTMEKGDADHYSELLGKALRITTPDAEVNRALHWSEIAVDQAWVCNPDLGCGLVAGYGPSRGARRPQYDWFFSGDGMLAIQSLLASGQYERAAQELEFIMKYQDQKSGMIWHELSQSAGLLDWDKYPYKFVHVDLTFDFLNTMANYYSVTGDREFVATHWQSIQSAYEYCRTLIDSKDGLPRIPQDKEGGHEQDALTDELSLSLAWAEAARSFADLATASDHPDAAKGAVTASESAKRAIAQRYWDKSHHSWISGYLRSGKPLPDQGLGPTRVNGQPLISETELDSLLSRFASSDFQSDWGTRGNASSALTYDPDSYSRGSVWATHTSGTASEFWTEHRPATAWPIWSALVQWSSLDSLGHMHEVLAGNYFHEEVESVPEQTWSSASFFAAAVHGLLGIEVDGVNKRATIAPHLPLDWNSVSLQNLRVGNSTIDVNLSQTPNEVRLDMQNSGAPVEIVFDPELPVGAELKRAELGNQQIAVKLEEHAEDTHARVNFTMPHGAATLVIRYAGGISIIKDRMPVMIGESSLAIKITDVHLQDTRYEVNLDYLPGSERAFNIRTSWPISSAQGAAVTQIHPGLYRIYVADADANKKAGYQHATVVLTLARSRGN